uniref:Cytochrome P450 n=1 Tax=Caenorhabditis tropicalis TaxID=1561998 RepID=A0A1I7UBT5_9PELO
MALIIPVFIALVALYILSFYKKIRNNLKFNYYGSKIPGPPLKFLMGNTYMFQNLPNEEIQVIFKREAKKARERGDTVLRYLLPGKLIVWPLDGKTLAQILESTTEIHKGSDYVMFEPWVGGLLLLVGDRWKAHRKMITPTFHFAKLEGYVNVFNQESKILIECLEKFADSGETVDIFPYINRCLLDIICETAMGTKVNAQFNHNHSYLKAVKGYTALMLKHSMTPILWSSFMFWALGYKKQQDDYLRTLKNFTAGVITERKAALESGEAETSNSKRNMNFLDMMLSMKESNALSEEELRGEVDTFMFGGHDTTTTSASWTVWCLAHNPEIQQKVYEEIMEICGEDMDVTYEQMNKMNYLDLVMKESKRMYPPVPGVQRQLQKDMIIDGYTVPAGANVAIAPVALHSNHLVFKDPEVFDPNRFLPEECSKRHAYDYIPFSAGIKNCIGQKFAVLNEKVLIIHLVRNYQIEPMMKLGETKPCFEVVSKPSKGIPVKLTKRV